jgi:hypothetical protein
MRSVLMSCAIFIKKDINYVMKFSFTQRGKEHLLSSTMVDNEKVWVCPAHLFQYERTEK